MSFANPSFLYFLFFALVPILLYFFNLQKVIRLDFSNIELLEDLKRKTSNRFQLKRLLILLARVFALIFIVFAFAQPSFKTQNKAVNKHHIIFLDNSLSMTRKVESSLLLDKAKAIVENAVQAKKGDKFSFITHQDLEINRDYYTKKELLKAIAQVTVSTGSLSPDQIAGILRRKESELSKKYYYVSDFQKTNSDLDQIKSSFDKDNSSLLVCNVAAEKENAFIDSVWIESKYLIAGNSTKINFRITNQGDEAKELLVKCLVEGSQMGSKVVQIEANANTSSTIDFQLAQKGYNGLVLQIEDPLVEFDNQYFCVLEANKNIRTLIVKGEQKSYFEAAYQNEALFLNKVFEESRLNSSELTQNDLIVLEGVQKLNNLPVRQLKQFVNEGGDLAIIPSSNQDLGELKTFLTNLAVPASINKIESQIPEEVDFAAVFKHPWFKDQFQSSDLKMQSVQFAPVFRINGGESILKSRKSTPLISLLSTIGNGNVMLYAVPLVGDKTNLMKHSLFVVSSYEMAMNSASINQNIGFEIGGEIVLREVKPNKSSYYSLKSTENQYTPQQQVQANNLIFSMDNKEQAGIYEVASSNELLSKVGLNFNRKESNFEALDLSSLNNSDNIEVQTWDASQAHVANDSELGLSKWKWWVLLALIALLVETALIRLYK